jgi:hypothetical protein
MSSKIPENTSESAPKEAESAPKEAESASKAAEKVKRSSIGSLLSKHFPTIERHSVRPEGFKGIVCDSLGYEQHFGECWSDTLQQIIMFADGFKEKTQEYMYTTPYPTLQTKINHLFESTGTEKTSERDDFQDTATRYVQYMQERFINHYDLLHSDDPEFLRTKQECSLNPFLLRTTLGPAVRRQKSMETAVSAARLFKNKYNLNIYSNSSGLSADIYNGLYMMLFNLFELNYSINEIDIIIYNQFCFQLRQLQKTSNNKNNNNNNNNNNNDIIKHLQINIQKDKTIIKSLFEQTNIKAIHISGFYIKKQGMAPESGHACAFLKCDSIYYYYDDNIGLLQVDIPNFEYLLEEKEIIPSFQNVKISGILLYPTMNKYYFIIAESYNSKFYFRLKNGKWEFIKTSVASDEGVCIFFTTYYCITELKSAGGATVKRKHQHTRKRGKN